MGRDTPTFATVNENYDQTQFSYFTQQWCTANRGEEGSRGGMMGDAMNGGMTIEMGEGPDGNFLKVTMGAMTTLATASAATIGAMTAL
jgi:hypothetical protein